MRRTAALVALGLVAAACTGPAVDPTFTRDDLPSLVLTGSDAPSGTTFVDGESGYLDLDQLTEDEAEARALRDAGFQDAYWTLFFDPRLREDPDRLNPDASEAASFAILFDSPEGAAEGLRALEAGVRADGSDLDERPVVGGPDAYAFHGDVDTDLPPGFKYGWRVGNVVQSLYAGGARGAIREDATRELAERMLARARAG